MSMTITKVSTVSGKSNTMELDITQKQLDRWAAGEHIQNVMPNLSADEREFLMTGITASEWDTLFPADDDDIEDIDTNSSDDGVAF